MVLLKRRAVEVYIVLNTVVELYKCIHLCMYAHPVGDAGVLQN